MLVRDEKAASVPYRVETEKLSGLIDGWASIGESNTQQEDGGKL